MVNIAITTVPERQNEAEAFAEVLSLKIIPFQVASSEYEFVLAFTSERVELHWLAEPDMNAIYVDFLHGAVAHRRRFGGGRGQLLAKAVGIKKNKTESLRILDATAGLGKDAFVLATLGCDVLMVERSPIIAALLRDGLVRAQQDPSFVNLKLQLLVGDAIDIIDEFSKDEKNTVYRPDVIYLDPMYPERTKSALVKKEMRCLRAFIGADLDAEKLLQAALKGARKRVVVKRPRLAPTISGPQPHLFMSGKSSRFDIYLIS